MTESEAKPLPQVIYLDVLLAVNLFVNYFLLLGTSCFFSQKAKRFRMVLSALTGSLFSVLILFDDLHPLLLWGIKLALACLLTLIAFGFGTFILYLKRTLIFFAVNFVFAGAMTALFVFASPKGMVIRNGTVYFNISALALVLGTVAAYGIIKLVTYLFRQRTQRHELYTLLIEQGGKQALVTGLADTGNQLCDSISGTPVIVCDFVSIKELIPLPLHSGIQSGDCGEVAAHASGRQEFKLRAIPYHAVGHQGMLICFEPEHLYLLKENSERCEIRALIGISSTPLSQGEYHAVINTKLLSDIK